MNWKRISYLNFLIISNLFPVYCVVKYNWPFFLVIWLYWLESLVLLVFDMAKLLLAEKKDSPSSGKKILYKKVFLALKMFIFKLGLLLFYLLFLIIFIALTEKDIDKFIVMAKTVGFQNATFNWALINFIGTAYLYYLFYYILNNEYKKSTPESFFNVFDVRTILLHLVIVLGVFANQAIGNKTFEGNSSGFSSNYVFLIIFILIKTFISITTSSYNNKLQEKAPMI